MIRLLVIRSHLVQLCIGSWQPILRYSPAVYQKKILIHLDCQSIILQFRINVLQLLISCWRAIFVVVRQEGQILSHFVVTDAIETKRQIIDFDRSCLKLGTVIWEMLPPCLEPAFLNGSWDGVVQNQPDQAPNCHTSAQKYGDDLIYLWHTYMIK